MLYLALFAIFPFWDDSQDDSSLQKRRKRRRNGLRSFCPNSLVKVPLEGQNPNVRFNVTDGQPKGESMTTTTLARGPVNAVNIAYTAEVATKAHAAYAVTRKAIAKGTKIRSRVILQRTWSFIVCIFSPDS